MFALLIFVLMIFAGLAIDVARIMHARSTLVSGVDATALAVGRAIMAGKSVSDAKDIGYRLFDANKSTAEQVAAAAWLVDINVDADNMIVRINGEAKLPMTFLRLTGINEVAVPTQGEVRYQLSDLEVGVALDVTGSMYGPSSAGGESKINVLKQVFKNFVDAVIPETVPIGKRMRIGFAPFSAAINLGPYAGPASNNRSVDNCVTERLADQYDDSRPLSGRYFAVAADGVTDIDPIEGVGDFYVCPAAELQPLTSDRYLLKSKVDTLVPSGFTSGHLGLQWAWNLVSEDYASFWPGASAPDRYSRTQGAKPTLIKAVIMMTDGVSNTAYRHQNSMQQQLELCTRMKAKGVKVFTVAFGLSTITDTTLRDQATNTLKACATPGTEYFADAENGAQLDAAFQSFAVVLSKLRVAR